MRVNFWYRKITVNLSTKARPRPLKLKEKIRGSAEVADGYQNSVVLLIRRCTLADAERRNCGIVGNP